MGRGPRRWVKLYCYEMLHGSVSYQLSEAEQSVWVKLLCFAGLCGNEGLISDHDLRPFPHSFIVHEIHADTEIFESTLKKCKAEGRISEDGQGIKITNWAKYQSEYERQRPYRVRRSNSQQPELSLEERIAVNKENERRLTEFKKHRGRV
jgi:hypothetical protein